MSAGCSSRCGLVFRLGRAACTTGTNRMLSPSWGTLVKEARYPVVPNRKRMKRAALETPSIQSLDRGLFILEAVAKAGNPVPLGHLTELLGIDRSSVFRLA